MAITLRTLDTNATLANHQTAIRQSEELGFRLLSLATGRVGGGRANLVTFAQRAGAPAAEISLEEIDGALDQAAQEAELNGPGRELVCYGSLYVQGTPAAVAAYRDSKGIPTDGQHRTDRQIS